MNDKIFSYKHKFLFLVMPVLILYISLPFFMLFLILSTIDIFTGSFVTGLEPMFKLLLSVSMSILIPLFISTEINMFPEIIIKKDGLRVKIFNFRWVWEEIPWNNVIDIQRSERKYRGGEVWLINVSNQLSIWHRLISRNFGEGNYTYIVVSHLLTDIDELVDIIKNKVNTY